MPTSHSHSLSRSLSPFFSIYEYLSLALFPCLSISHSQSLSLFLHIYESLFISQSQSHSISHYNFFFLSFPHIFFSLFHTPILSFCLTFIFLSLPYYFYILQPALQRHFLHRQLQVSLPRLSTKYLLGKILLWYFFLL